MQILPATAAEKIGHEAVTYVANIAKYYITYRMQFDMQQTRLKIKEEILEIKK